jgi:Tfp pilus assembly protein PilZ
MEDKRRYPRLDISAGVAWRKVGTAADAEENSDMAKNISPYGICLITYKNLSVGEQILLSIDLPNHRAIKATGKVIWSKRFGTSAEANYDSGIEFVDISPEDRRVLKQLVLFPHGDGR